MNFNLLTRNLFLLSFFFIACSSSNSPRPVAKEFLDAFQKHDFEEAKKYSTKETVKLLQVLERISKENNEPAIEMLPIEITSEEIAGDKATVYFKEAGNPTEQKLMLKKVSVAGEKEKQWRVVLTKEDARFGNEMRLKSTENP